MTDTAITCVRDTTIDITNATLKDDTVYNVIDDQATVNIFDKIWPIGSLYFGIMETCPLAALFGTWEKISAGRVIQGADENHLPGTFIEAGLPNITGTFSPRGDTDGGSSGILSADGAFAAELSGSIRTQGSSVITGFSKASFDASRSNQIYGNSDTVQPAAFVVNIWQRTA